MARPFLARVKKKGSAWPRETSYAIASGGVSMRLYPLGLYDNLLYSLIFLREKILSNKLFMDTVADRIECTYS